MDLSNNASILYSYNMSNQTKCNKNLEMPLDIVFIGSIVYIAIFVVGVTGNSLVIYVLLKDKRMRNFTNYLLANLSIADLMVLFTCVPTGLHDLFAKERWYLGKLMCYSIAFIENCMGFASILTIFFITCDRFYVICRPLKVRAIMTQARTFKLIIFIWVISIVINMPFIFFTNYKLAHFFDCTTAYKCYIKLQDSFSYYYIITVYFINYFLIGFVLLLMYMKIFKFLNDSNKFLKECSKIEHSFAHDSYKSFGLNLIDYNNNQNNLNNNLEEDANAKNRLFTSQNNIILFKKDSLINDEDNVMIYSNSKYYRYIKQRKQIIGMLVFLIIVFYVCLFPLKIWNLGNLNLADIYSVGIFNPPNAMLLKINYINQVNTFFFSFDYVFK